MLALLTFIISDELGQPEQQLTLVPLNSLIVLRGNVLPCFSSRRNVPFLAGSQGQSSLSSYATRFYRFFLSVISDLCCISCVLSSLSTSGSNFQSHFQYTFSVKLLLFEAILKTFPFSENRRFINGFCSPSGNSHEGAFAKKKLWKNNDDRLSGQGDKAVPTRTISKWNERLGANQEIDVALYRINNPGQPALSNEVAATRACRIGLIEF